MKQSLPFRWRKRSILTENSSLRCFIKSWTKLKSLWMKVIWVPGIWNMNLRCILYHTPVSTHPMHYNLCSLLTDDTDNINQVISSNSPKSCFSYLTDLEKKGDPYADCNHLTRLVDSYTRVFANMPLGKHCENESYARMLVRFAELKVWVAIAIAWIWKYSSFCCCYCCLQRVLGYLDFYSHWIRIQDVTKAEDNFKVASSHCQNFAFVHIAHAQFERSQGKVEHIFTII